MVENGLNGGGKTCPRCHRTLPLDTFGKNARSKDGRQSWCRPCAAAWAREGSPRKLVQGPPVDVGEKWCRRCEQVKRLENFSLHSKMRDGRQTYCRECFADIYRAKRSDAGFVTRPKDIPAGHKFCRGCQQVLPLSQWPVRTTSRDGVATRCTRCTIARDRERNLTAKYGLTLAQVEDLIAGQNGVCAICQAAAPVHVDHDHETGTVRGHPLLPVQRGARPPARRSARHPSSGPLPRTKPERATKVRALGRRGNAVRARGGLAGAARRLVARESLLSTGAAQ